MKTSKAKFEAKVELIPTAKLVGISGLNFLLLAANRKIKFKYNTSLLCGEKV